MKSYKVLNRQTVGIPSLCAWCGRRPEERLRATQLSHQVLWIQTRMVLSLPICELCDAYVRALQRAEMQSELLLYVLWVPLSAVVVHLGLQSTGDLGDWLAFAVGTLGLAMLLVRGSVLLLRHTTPGVRLLRALAGKPPHGYASQSAAPGEVTKDMRPRFYSPEFHRHYSELNPDAGHETGQGMGASH